MSTDADGKKIALITGGNKGIGLETARQLGALGIVVLIGARDEAKGRAAADGLRAKGVDARNIVLEVTNKASIDAAASQVAR